MEQTIVHLALLGGTEKQMVNNVCNSSFHKPMGEDYVSLVKKDDTMVSLLRNTGEIIGVAFIDLKKCNVDPKYSSPIFYHLHSIAISKEFRGKGLCRKLVHPIVKKYGRVPIYLNVRTTLGNPNVSAIKCYRHFGFTIVPTVNVEMSDGPNSLMIRLPKKTKTRKKRRRSKNK
jgi:ribosomal protein S18 acetylase RimI-like enzyme